MEMQTADDSGGFTDSSEHYIDDGDVFVAVILKIAVKLC